MVFDRKNGLKSRNLWISLLKLLITLCIPGVWKSHPNFGFCGKLRFFHKSRPQGKMHKGRRAAKKMSENGNDKILYIVFEMRGTKIP